MTQRKPPTNHTHTAQESFAARLPPDDGADFERARRIGVDRIMWGSDYPHVDACSPHSKESLRHTFRGWSEADLRKVLSENAAKVYKFDLSKLAPLAQHYGPTVDELATPLASLPDNQSPAFSRP